MNLITNFNKLKYLFDIKRWLFIIMALSVPTTLFAAAPGGDFTDTGFGIAALIIFIIAYTLVVSEEFLHLRKSKPVIVAAGLIWILVSIAYAVRGDSHTAAEALRHNLLEYAEIMLFLLSAMTYINAMEERGVFNALRTRLVSTGYSLRTITAWQCCRKEKI